MEAGPVHLTPDDTAHVITRASTITGTWGTIMFAQDQDPYVLDVTRWSADIMEKQHPHRSTTLDHDKVVAAMRAMVAARDTLNLSTRTLDQFAAVLDAPGPDAAREELEQVDCFGCDALIQYALLGVVTYG